MNGEWEYMRAKPCAHRCHCQYVKSICRIDEKEIFKTNEFLSGQSRTVFLISEKSLTEHMKKSSMKKFALLAITLTCINSAFSQQSKVEAEKPVFDDILSPEFSGGKQKAFKPKDWLEMETKIKVQLAPEPASKTAEEIMIKWYVAVKNPEKAGYFFLLTKSITHINVPLNDEIFSSVYLSPASTMKLTGSAKGGKNAVEFVGYEVLIGGEIKAADTNKGKVGWWKASSEKISASTSVPLLSKHETPFANMWWDRYAEVKLEK
jgi:hypothetical protein